MTLDEPVTKKGIPVLEIIRKHLGLSRPKLAKAAGISGEFVRQLEGGISDCAQHVLRSLAAALACEVADFFTKPNKARLKQIKIAYLKLQADHARAEAADLAKSEQGAA